MLNTFDLRNRELLDGIQGNILKAHGRHHTANLFIHCDDGRQAEAKAWLKSLVDPDDGIIRSGYVQLRSNVLWKEANVDTGLFACVHISAVGYDYLFGENARLNFSDSSFQNGMKNAELNDPAIVDWEEGLRADNHFMLLLANADTDALMALIEEIEQDILLFGRINKIERGDALLNREGAGLEHFGYVDGVSQPLFFDDEWEEYKAQNNIRNDTEIQFDSRAELDLVLINDPFGAGDPNAFGSYFVFRKLGQDVRGFKTAEQVLADELNLVGEDRERAGAMLVGRFEDGTPVQLSDEAGIIHSAVTNNFDYDIDIPSKCPYHAHIRKSNPRSSMPTGFGGVQEAKRHIIARRGIPFGERQDDPNDGQLDNKPVLADGVGLLFMSYQASIINQFEFIQKNWVNNSSFPHLDLSVPDGLDPVIGQGMPREAGAFPARYGNPLTLTRAGFDQFVHMKGGEYFFAPSMNFLKTVDTILIA
ncbi:Dyp-type peroxidase [Spirosoma pollinicola]|uniref:Peroxidase n=1 Tax=Spirosoma pollinicola TaxID=2057025 RepID=A0A2K8Z5P2_9BACT|nr:peroxidase [Spirosoma pollinicola]AUD05139.1 peroxidase [Spirosoma pollinicola]